MSAFTLNAAGVLTTGQEVSDAALALLANANRPYNSGMLFGDGSGETLKIAGLSLVAKSAAGVTYGTISLDNYQFKYWRGAITDPLSLLIDSNGCITLPSAGASGAINVGSGGFTVDAYGNVTFGNASSLQLNAGDLYLNDGSGSGGGSLYADGGTIVALGKLQVTNSAIASSSVSGLSHKWPIYNATGTLLGYIPIYNTIT